MCTALLEVIQSLHPSSVSSGEKPLDILINTAIKLVRKDHQWEQTTGTKAHCSTFPQRDLIYISLTEASLALSGSEYRLRPHHLEFTGTQGWLDPEDKLFFRRPQCLPPQHNNCLGKQCISVFLLVHVYWLPTKSMLLQQGFLIPSTHDPEMPVNQCPGTDGISEIWPLSLERLHFLGCCNFVICVFSSQGMWCFQKT